MTLERVALVILALIAAVMGANYVSAASRFLDAQRAYDSLTLSLEEFSYTNAESPVYIDINVDNPADTAVEVLALRLTLRAGVPLVGGGEIRVEDVLEPHTSTTYRIEGRIDDVNYVSGLDPDEAIHWLLRGEIQVRLDADVEPVWIRFSVATVTE